MAFALKTSLKFNPKRRSDHDILGLHKTATRCGSHRSSNAGFGYASTSRKCAITSNPCTIYAGIR